LRTPELIGEWAHRTDYCGKGGGHMLYITRSGYTGLDDEGFGCDLKSIRRPDLSFKATWTIESSCSGENPKKVTIKSIFILGEFEGGDLLIEVTLVYRF
jgi:hypothetical protein